MDTVRRYSMLIDGERRPGPLLTAPVSRRAPRWHSGELTGVGQSAACTETAITRMEAS
jgi:hypothetical protein